MKNLISYFAVIIGGFITAYGLESVLIPNQVSDGGVTGLGIVGSQFFGVPLAVFLIVGNMPFLYLGYKQIGKTFTIKSILGIVSLAVGTSLMHHTPTIIEGDTLLITVIGGIIIGFGMGVALRNGGALDGIDMLAVLLSRKLPFGTGEIILALNVFVFAVVSLVFGLKGAVLSAIAYFIASKVIALVEEGLGGSKTFKIITKKPEELLGVISNRLGRGGSWSYMYGAYKGERHCEVTCVINRMEEAKMKEIIKEVDPQAFITIYDVAEVRGGSFTKRDIH